MTASRAGTAARAVRLQLSGDLLPPREHGGLMEAAYAGLSEVWSELGLLSRPVVHLEEVPGDRLAGVLLDGQPLVLSAKRCQAIAVAVTGEPHRVDEPADVQSFLSKRAREATADSRRELVASLLCATVRGAMAAAVSGEAEALATSCVPAASARLVPLATRALVLAAELGVPPSHLDPSLLSTAIGEPGDDPYRVCDTVVSEAVESGRLSPVLEFNRSTLRRLTLSAQPLRSSLMASEDWRLGMPRMIRYDSIWHYGITLPDIALGVADDLADDRCRVRFGRLRTPCRLVLAEGSVAVDNSQPALGDRGPDAYHVDPVYGERWPVFEGGGEQPLAAFSTPYDPAALVIRAVYAELCLRLAWWTPDWLPVLAEGYPFSGALLARLRERIRPVLRWLVADGVALRHEEPVLEGMVASFAHGDDAVPTLVSQARQVLGAAVLGVLPGIVDMDVLPLDPATADEAVRANSLAPLLERHPELLSTAETFVVTAPAAVRASLQRLLRPLKDVLLLAAVEEVQDAVLHLPATIGSDRPG
jgi:hypothetical protein